MPFASPLTGLVTDALTLADTYTAADTDRHSHSHIRACVRGTSLSRESLTLLQQRGFRALARSQYVRVFTTCSVSGCPLLTANCVLLKWMPAQRRSWRERRAGDKSPPDVLSTCCSAASLALRSSVNSLQQRRHQVSSFCLGCQTMVDAVMNDSSLQDSRSKQAKSEQLSMNAGILDSLIKLHQPLSMSHI